MAEEFIDGLGYVLGWKNARILVNKNDIENLLSITCTKSVQYGVGDAQFVCVDPDRSIFDAITVAGDNEVEIYMTDLNETNKVWGGYVYSAEYDMGSGFLTKIYAKYYSSRLQTKRFTYSPSGELSTKFGYIMDNYQPWFYTENLESTSGKTVDFTFTNEYVHTALKKLCDQHNYYYYIGTDKQAHLVKKGDTTNVSPDSIVWGTNVYAENKTTYNYEKIANDVLVQASASVSATASDSTSQTDYWESSLVYTDRQLTSTASAQSMANTLLEAQKENLKMDTISTSLLAYTEPGNYIAVDVDELDLYGDYQVIELTHDWSKRTGFKSTVKLGDKIPVSAMMLGEFEKRLRQAEAQAAGL